MAATSRSTAAPCPRPPACAIAGLTAVCANSNRWAGFRWARSSCRSPPILPDAALQPIIGALMNYRRLGKTGFNISEISLGTWQVGGRWGDPFDAANAERIIESAIDAGVNFIDTADVYSDRLSEA